jgi:aldehyde:ferredoxin oxidoreductase
MFGWAGTILRVDLSKGKVVRQPLPKDLAYSFLGQRGFNVKTLYEEVGSDVDPLGPENRLMFGVGPLSGTIAPQCGRWNVTARSPLTNIIGDSNGGGHWGPELKWAGYDQIVIQGRAEHPVYLWINDDEVELRDASNIWGYTSTETLQAIREETGEPEVKVNGIGPGGENLVKTAPVISDLTRAAGRCGLGAVMGSKKLKAIAVRGTKAVQIAKPDLFEKLCNEVYEVFKNDPLLRDMAVQGTNLIFAGLNTMGRLRVRNWQQNVFEEAANITGEELLKYCTKKKGCFNCQVSCSHYYVVREGPYAGTHGEGPEYEAQDGFGANLGIGNWPAILHMNTLVNELGLDVCSVAADLSWAMECYQRGIITEKDTGGIKLEWGNPEIAIDMIKKIAYRDGFGNLLAEGAYNAAQKIGRGAEKYVMHSKRLTLSAVELRGAQGWGLAFATSTRGADHLRGPVFISTWGFAPDLGEKYYGTKKAVDRFSPEGKPIITKEMEEKKAVIDSLGVCQNGTFLCVDSPYFVDDRLALIVSAATGWDIDGKGLREIGERIWHVEKAFNIKMGYGTRSEDWLPDRFTKELCPYPPANDDKALVKLEAMLSEYYKLRGWDPETGLVPRANFERLGLKQVANDLERMGKLPQQKRKEPTKKKK